METAPPLVCVRLHRGVWSALGGVASHSSGDEYMDSLRGERLNFLIPYILLFDRGAARVYEK